MKQKYIDIIVNSKDHRNLNHSQYAAVENTELILCQPGPGCYAHMLDICDNKREFYTFIYINGKQKRDLFVKYLNLLKKTVYFKAVKEYVIVNLSKVICKSLFIFSFDTDAPAVLVYSNMNATRLYIHYPNVSSSFLKLCSYKVEPILALWLSHLFNEDFVPISTCGEEAVFNYDDVINIKRLLSQDYNLCSNTKFKKAEHYRGCNNMFRSKSQRKIGQFYELINLRGGSSKFKKYSYEDNLEFVLNEIRKF